MQLIDEEYTRHPFFSTRRMQVYLPKLSHPINRKRVQRLMSLLGMPPHTSKAHPLHKVYPYLLRGLDMVRLNQAWSCDITINQKSAMITKS
jgi:putative transposase